jgi:predicted DNA-binding antitoxin AbrB/MazE fold protein
MIGRGTEMSHTIRAVVRGGRIEPLEKVEIPDGTEVLVTPLSDEKEFWLAAGEDSLAAVWDNPEDDVYAALLKE